MIRTFLLISYEAYGIYILAFIRGLCLFLVYRFLKMQKPSSAARSEFIVGGKYKLLRKIGSGSFGDIYQGINITNCEVRICNIRGRISILKLLFKCTLLP